MARSCSVCELVNLVYDCRRLTSRFDWDKLYIFFEMSSRCSIHECGYIGFVLLENEDSHWPICNFFFFLNVTELLYLEVWLNWSFTYKHLLKYFFSSIL